MKKMLMEIRTFAFLLIIIFLGSLYVSLKPSLPIAQQIILGLLAWAVSLTLFVILEINLGKGKLYIRVIYLLFTGFLIAQIYWQGRVTIVSAAIIILFYMILFIDKRFFS